MNTLRCITHVLPFSYSILLQKRVARCYNFYFLKFTNFVMMMVEKIDSFDDNNAEDVVNNNAKKKSKIVNTSSDVNAGSPQYKWKIVWRNVIAMTFLHIGAVYGYYYIGLDPSINSRSFLMIDVIGRVASIGVLAGAHRLWSHRAYKATLPLRIMLMIFQTMCLQNDIYEWCRDHRTHHRFSETDADPHNSKRGFFFAHMGWLLVRKHPDVKAKGKLVDLSDLWLDPVVRFQRRFYIPLVIVFWMIIPTYIPHYICGTNLWHSFLGAVIFRYVYSLHCAWLVNSAAHLYGSQPYDKQINPRENKFVAYVSMGEGYHNYHHVFPYDYSASELGWEHNFNLATIFIDVCAWLGLAYDLKKPSKETVSMKMKRCGDGKEKTINIYMDYFKGFIANTAAFWFTLLFRYLLNGQF